MGGSATVFSVEELMKLHRGFTARGEFRRLGRMVKIVLGEVPAEVPLKLSAAEIATEGRTLDWFDEGPLLGLSPSDVDLLCVSKLGTVLPDKPKPGWRSPEVTQQEIERAIETNGKWSPAKAPLVRQLPEERGARKMRGANILLFEPVYQVLFRPEGINVFGCVWFRSDPGSATVPTFVWDFDERGGYFYGGRFRVEI